MRRSLIFFFTPFLSAYAQDPTPDLGWQAVARMSEGRYHHCAVSLGDGRAFVAGGIGANGPLATAEIFGPDNSFQTVPPMSQARSQHSCTLLADGRVLVDGGSDQAGAELFDPVSKVWSAVSGGSARRGQTATMISGDQVLLAGGWSGDQPVTTLEIYDPVAEQISSAPAALAIARARHTAVRLSDGRVLFIGGTDGANSLGSTEIFDPATSTVSSGSPLVEARAGHVTATLLDGRVLVAAGASGAIELASAEIYSEATNSFSPLNAALTIARQDAFATVIPGSGLVLIGGGTGGGQPLPDTELFDPVNNRFLVAGALTAARTSIQGAVLADGVILATGGRNDDGPSDACGVFVTPRLTFTKSQYDFGETAVVNGSGFTGFAGRTMRLALTVSPGDGSATRSVDSSRLLAPTVVPDSTGQFQASILTLNSGDANSTFFLQSNPPLFNISDGSSNTIGASASAFASFSGPILADTILTFDPIPASSVAGSTIPFTVTLNSSKTIPFNGLVHIRVGPTVKAFSVSNQAPGTPATFNFCCVDTAGVNQIVNVNYGVDPHHLSVSVNGATHTVVARQVQISLGFQSLSQALLGIAPTLPLFQASTVPVVISVPAALGPALGGSVSLTRQLSGAAAQVATLAGQGPLVRGASFPFRATFAEKPTACFTATYSGDGFYPSTSGTVCMNTAPALTKLQVTGADNYTFDTGYPVQITLTFPSELGIANRTVHLEPTGQDITLTTGVGSATASTTLTLPFAATGITATYAGGPDLSSATGRLAFSMNPIPTATLLAPIASPASNPITLAANVVPNVGRNAGPPVAPSGVVQFFDGSLFLGQVSLVAQTNGSGRATLTNVARPVGVRQIKAVYLGSTQFATSASVVTNVTIQ